MTTTDPRVNQRVNDTQTRFDDAGPSSLVGHGPDEPHLYLAGQGSNIRSGHQVTDPQERVAVAEQAPHRAEMDAAPMASLPGGEQLVSDQNVCGTHDVPVGDARQPMGSVTPNGTPAGGTDIDVAHLDIDAQRLDGDVAGQDRAHCSIDAHMADGPVLADPLMALAADVLDDLERVRIANENRLRQLTRDEADADGEERGFGLTLDHPDVKRLATLVDGLAKAEHDATLNLNRLMRQHPLGPWVKQARGVGEKQAARLLATIGDPWWNDLHDRPRTVSELWAYCGYHVLRTGHFRDDHQGWAAGPGQAGGDPGQTLADPQEIGAGVAATRARGQRANWSATAKMRAHLVATSIVKCGGPYREVYDDGRANYSQAVHAVACKRCGPKDHPAQPGSPLSDGHKHARALRLVCKAVLRDLWRESKRLHEHHDGQWRIASQESFAVVGPTPGDHCKGDDRNPAVAGISTGGGVS